MRTRRYNKKIIGMLMLPLVVGSVSATPVFSADLTPAAGETVTLSGQSNVDRIVATGDGVNVTLTEDAKLAVDNAYPSVYLYGGSTVTLNAGSSISNNTSADNWVYAPAVSIINNNFTANTTNTVTLNNATINANSTGNYVHPSGIYLQDYSNDGTSVVTLDNNSHVNTTSTVTNLDWTYAHALGVYVGGTKNAIVTLSNNSSVSVTAVSDTAGFTNASAEVSWSTKGIYADSQTDGVASITLSDNSSVNVTGSASSDSWSSTGFINGVYANSQGGGDAIITLDSGSSVNIGTNATVNGTYAFAASNHIYGLTAWTDYGDTVITLNNDSSVSAVATVTMENAVDPDDIKA
ncbi:MAG: hypothetical protein OEL66_02385, partial [Desulfobulbaceae bacterium]|nr:hypothetical protein [Desulfobulbaceae bacterium]